MKTASRELTLSNALSDPLIRTLMAADNVDPMKLESMPRQIAEKLEPGLSPSTERRDPADNIPGARFVELPGENHLPPCEAEIPDRMVGEVEECVTNSRKRSRLSERH
jgi:hypothetical protein